MAGHNKWSQIKERKSAADAKKSQVFGKIGKLIASESKKARGDTSSPALRAAIEKAKKLNVPAESIERAVKKGLGADAQTMEEVVYEAYGPGGVAMVIFGLTDNKNRTSPEIRHLLSRHGVTLAGHGAALWAFEKTVEGLEPSMTTPLSDEDVEKLSALVEELENHDDVQEVYTNAE